MVVLHTAAELLRPSEYIQRKALELSRSVENYHDFTRQINAIGTSPRKQYTMEGVKELFSLSMVYCFADCADCIGFCSAVKSW